MRRRGLRAGRSSGGLGRGAGASKAGTSESSAEPAGSSEASRARADIPVTKSDLLDQRNSRGEAPRLFRLKGEARVDAEGLSRFEEP